MSHTDKGPAGPRAAIAGANLVVSRRKFLKLSIVGIAAALPLVGAAGCGGGGGDGEEKKNGKKKEGDGGGDGY